MATTIQYLDRAELEELLEQKMATLLLELKKMASQSGVHPSKDVFLNQKQAANYMGISKPTFNKIKDGFTEYRISPGRCGYLKSEIDTYLEKSSISPRY